MRRALDHVLVLAVLYATLQISAAFAVPAVLDYLLGWWMR